MHSPKPALFAAILESLRNARRVHQDQRLLRAMNERELSDLGVGRSEIPALLQPCVPTRRDVFSGAGAPQSAPRSHARCAAAAGQGARP
ncbi:DUF1127 domain-containing protein [Variovorax sp. GT1P44]|uniref:DUF1127 domain-containing protein n=1 Tax=Variovorax sp. GT1P44 TaxID=3443742 RepID=UPI003F48123D